MSKSINKGFITEADHFESLKISFDNVSEPKGSGGGSDFIAIHDDRVISFESKTSNTDVFDAGVVSILHDGLMVGSSGFLSNNNIIQINNVIRDNLSTIQDYTQLANTNCVPHIINIEDYNNIKKQNKLVHIISKDPLENIIENSFLKSNNTFIKANYIIFDKLVYCISKNPDYDPLNLQSFGAAVLTDDDIDYFTIRTARSGTRNNRASVSMRIQFRLKNNLPKTKVTII